MLIHGGLICMVILIVQCDIVGRSILDELRTVVVLEERKYASRHLTEGPSLSPALGKSSSHG